MPPATEHGESRADTVVFRRPVHTGALGSARLRAPTRRLAAIAAPQRVRPLDCARMKRVPSAAGVAAIVLVSLASPALGHAELISAEPADSSTVEGPSISVVLTYDEPLAEGSSASLDGPSGPEVILAIDPADPNRMTSGPDPLPVEPGAYTIQWTSVGVDGDIERGTVKFTVTAPPPTATAAPQTPAPSPTATPAPGDGGPGDTSDVILPIVVGLIVVALVAWWLLRRGPASA